MLDIIQGMQFQVPQFIEVEDKIFGPLTFKQFVYLLGGAGVGYMLWRTLPLVVAAPLIMAFVGLGAALAFFQYNGQPFILALEHGFYYFVKSKLYLWSNDQALNSKNKSAAAKIAALPAPAPYIPHLADSKLHELAWSLDIKERIAAEPDELLKPANPMDLVAPVHTARDALVR
jgi:hypothetical protein